MVEERSNGFVELAHARLDEQRRVMEAIVAAGHCPFCDEHMPKYHTQPTLQENASWILTPNQWPYENTRVHLLTINKRHVERLQDLTDADWKDLGALLMWAQQRFDIPGGALGMRFGDLKFSGATVKHLHAQLIVPKEDTATGIPARVPLWTGTKQ